MISIYLGLPSPSRPEWVRILDPQRMPLVRASKPRWPRATLSKHLTQDAISPVSVLRARPPTVHRLQATRTVHAWCKFWCDLAESAWRPREAQGIDYNIRRTAQTQKANKESMLHVHPKT